MATVSLRQIYRCQVVDQNREVIGTVDDVLFHPRDPLAVGFSVKPFRVGGVVPLPKRYLSFHRSAFDSDGRLEVVLDEDIADEKKATKEANAAWGTKAERELGFLWDDTIIYYGQAVFTESGAHLGKVSDARFDIESGTINGIQVTAGTAADAALGKRTIPGKSVLGFSLEHYGILVDDSAAEIPFEGGVAESAGKATAVATDAAQKVTETAVKGIAKATVYTERAVQQAANSPAGKKARGWLSSFAENVKEAMKDEENG